MIKRNREKLVFVYKKNCQIQMRQILANFSQDEKFVKTMSSNFSSRCKEAKKFRQMNRSQKLKRKYTCIRHIQPHHSHPRQK